MTVSSPAVIRPLAKLNEGKRYADQIKPFNFLLTCQVKPFGHPSGVNPEHFHLIATYEKDPTSQETANFTLGTRDASSDGQLEARAVPGINNLHYMLHVLTINHSCKETQRQLLTGGTLRIAGSFMAGSLRRQSEKR